MRTAWLAEQKRIYGPTQHDWRVTAAEPAASPSLCTSRSELPHG
jgi:hypothetical protein